jgi:phosphoglycerate dehydrogenase-like enzyme
MSSPGVIITARNVLQDGRATVLLRDAGLRVVEAPGGVANANLTADAARSIAAVVVGSDLVDDRTLAGYPNVTAVLRAGSGTDNIRVGAGIIVAALPGFNAQSVADYTFGLILSATRRIAEADRLVRNGGWAAITGADVYRRTLGIVGLGAVGRAVAARAAGFEMTVLGVDPSGAGVPGVRLVTLDELVAAADVVTLHAPLTPQTRHLIGAAELARMKPGAVLVNAARGELVDETALLDALRRGVIAGAALDAFENEPHLRAEWRQLDNVVLSPHTASFGDTTMRRLGAEVATTVQRLIEERL